MKQKILYTLLIIGGITAITPSLFTLYLTLQGHEQVPKLLKTVALFGGFLTMLPSSTWTAKSLYIQGKRSNPKPSRLFTAFIVVVLILLAGRISIGTSGTTTDTFGIYLASLMCALFVFMSIMNCRDINRHQKIPTPDATP